ncbi:Cell division control protein 4 [Vanrija pseudolonga]|uniref:Cell division control protein 4 n=1 Tax=Vanrija pseudolonga TaxID=143232 RepID=A0AAF0Y9A7_9TREE|nr:Cell division control protein 4 [Vanrija pseudolonga]
MDQPHPHAGPSSRSGLVWTRDGPVLKMEDAVVETVVTHTTRTTTSFAPIPLPRIPVPDAIPMPTHLSSSEGYPLANEPTPDDMRFVALTLGGRRVLVQEDGNILPDDAGIPGETCGPGWTRSYPSSGNDERVGLAGYLNKVKSKEVRKRPHERSRPVTVVGSSSGADALDEGGVRKKIRASEDLASPPDASGALLSPLPSPGAEDRELSPSSSTPSLGSGLEVATLLSLPSIVAHFELLPSKVQQHVLMHLFRRSRMPTIQRISAFASTALKRDFLALLPHEIAVQVLRKVDVKSLAASARVSKKWRKMVDSERSVWRTRLVEDGLWYGHGVESEEEIKIQRRFETLDWKASRHRAVSKKAGTPSEDESMVSVTNQTAYMLSVNDAPPPPPDDRPTPLKHIYRRRHVSSRNWLKSRPQHTSFAGHGTNVVTCVQFDEDKIVSASDDHSINIYCTRTGQLKKRLDGHEGGVWALEYKGDTLVSGSTDRTVRVWDLESLQQSHVFFGHTSTVRCLQIVEPVFDEATGEYQPPYPMIVTGSRDASLRVWKLPKKGEPAYMSSSRGSDAHVPPEQNPFHVHHLEGHSEAVRALAAHGRICVSGSYDKTVRVWDIVKGTCIHVLFGHEQKVYSIVYDRFRNRCASGSMDNTVKVWDIATGTCLHTLTGHTSLVGLLGASPNYIVSAAADASLRVWDANTHELKHVLSSHAAAITCFQHDETKVVSGSDGTLKLWDIRTGQCVRDLIVGISSVWQVAFHGNLLVAASNRAGNTVFDVFDFGAEPDPSGVDNERLDRLRRPPWERGNPREPQTYQSDDLQDLELDSVSTRDSRVPSPDTAEMLRKLGVSPQTRRSNRLAGRTGITDMLRMNRTSSGSPGGTATTSSTQGAWGATATPTAADDAATNGGDVSISGDVDIDDAGGDGSAGVSGSSEEQDELFPDEDAVMAEDME